MTELTEATIPAASPRLYLDCLAHDLLRGERAHRDATISDPVAGQDPATLALTYATACRLFNDHPLPPGIIDRVAIVAAAAERVGACPACLEFTGHHPSCLVPF